MKNTPPRKRSQATSFTKKVFEFLTRVAADRKLPPHASAIAIDLTRYFNRHHGGVAWPSCRTIANDIGVDKATVLRTLRVMEARGHLRIEWGTPGRGHGSKFWIGSAKEKVQPRTFKTARKGAVKGAAVSRKGAGLHQNLSNNHSNRGSLEASTEGRESASRNPEDGAGGLVAAAPKDDAMNIRGGGPSSSPLQFETLRTVWQRPWCDDPAEARRAFMVACRDCDPADILDGARDWVAAADAPRFLPPLAKWLSARGWEKPSPMRRSGHRKANLHDRFQAAATRDANATVLHFRGVA